MLVNLFLNEFSSAGFSITGTKICREINQIFYKRFLKGFCIELYLLIGYNLNSFIGHNLEKL